MFRVTVVAVILMYVSYSTITQAIVNEVNSTDSSPLVVNGTVEVIAVVDRWLSIDLVRTL